EPPDARAQPAGPIHGAATLGVARHFWVRRSPSYLVVSDAGRGVNASVKPGLCDMPATGVPAAAQRVNRLRAIASRQLGLFTREQARLAGFSPGSIDKRVSLRLWIAIDHGVYRVAEAPGSWRQRLLAACLAGPAVASHRAAAALWRFPTFGEAEIEVTALRHRRRTADDVIWHESVRLDDRHVTEADFIPITRPVRTLLDLGAVVDASRLLLAFDDAVRRNLASRPALEE